MRRIFILLCLITRACFEIQTVQHFYISRKTRPNLPPVKAGYVYTQVNDEPVKFSSFYNKINDRSKTKADDEIDSSLKLDENKIKEKCTACDVSTYNNKSKGPPQSRKDIHDSMSERAENLYEASSNIETNQYFHPDDVNQDFHTDDEDIRTDSRNYYGWPYFYHSLYEYEPMNVNIEYEKAKDKRFISPGVDKIIPVYENVEEDVPDTQKYSGYNDMNIFTTDNPNYGNQPFFSYVLNDYFDHTYDDDPLHFKGVPWEHKIPFKDIYDSSKRVRRLNDNKPEYRSDFSHGRDTLQETSNGKNYDSDHESESNENGKDNKYSYTGDYKENDHNYRGFKDFADAFTNRFGSEDHNKVAKYSIKNNTNKGGKKKGFRKVYHKDEYQEHDEFFDDNNNSFNKEENGESKVRVGGSDALLRSQAAAALGNNQNKLNKAENIVNHNFDEKRAEKQRHKGIENNYNQYRDLVKNAAFSNNADYFNI
ncbi:probable serine/threonine-protein kinase clkA [Nymphalis io]|uniref:probable serine/threonine-protein kinase clkA n=1 Tax=Inachis io TaxID=171585 RepID=UPI0021687525|nr:probable serine/threonine-protein kinase clkA [Nymphalis io]